MGIFFSGEDTGTGITMQAAVAEINEEYGERLDQLKEENEHEVFRLSGSRAPWKDVLAVYAVKVNTDSENPQVVANLTEEKKELLRGVFLGYEYNLPSDRQRNDNGDRRPDRRKGKRGGERADSGENSADGQRNP